MNFAAIVFRRLYSKLFKLRVDGDFFELLDQWLIFSAIQLKSRRILLRIAFRLYQLLLPVQCIFWFSRVWVVAVIDRNVSLTVSLICAALAVTSIVIRYALILRCCGRFSAVRAYINSRQYLRGLPEAHEIRERAFRTNNTILVVLQAYCLMNITVFMATDMQQHEIFRIPDYIRRTTEPLFWVMHYLMQPMVLTGLATYMGSFIIPNALLIGLRAELQLVQLGFQRVFQLVDTRAHQVDHQLNPNAREDLAWRALHQELAVCVHEHCKVMQHVREVHQILNVSVMVQYYCALLALAVDGFFISYHGFDFVAFTVVVFSLLLVFEWFYRCKLVEDLQTIHNHIGWTLYNANWPAWLQCSRRHRTSLRQLRDTLNTVQAISQRSLSCQGSEIVEVSWRAFSNLFKTSYSVLMFLIEMRRLNRTNLQ
ncbi:AGAP000230-PA-like protein [Anopheles sinensis]|uniref:AGAP000230-PA-like protein n=1 Tax=Anopheles sinensis TaxID=74873 RepID=A0A084VLN9_ANOSI|nr:AGAP000230-PA-like protein [Anopheles sinensis]